MKTDIKYIEEQRVRLTNIFPSFFLESDEPTYRVGGFGVQIFEEHFHVDFFTDMNKLRVGNSRYKATENWVLDNADKSMYLVVRRVLRWI